MTSTVVPVSQATEPATATPDLLRYAAALTLWISAVIGYIWGELYTPYRILTLVGLATIAVAAYTLAVLA